jgi:hypothetical protein
MLSANHVVNYASVAADNKIHISGIQRSRIRRVVIFVEAGLARRVESMKRILMASAVVLLSLLTFAPAASARGRFVIGGGYGLYGPRYYGGYRPGWYGPYWGRPYGFYPNANEGNVKIVTQVKGDSIFVDGGFAGITGKLKKFPLRPGTHTIEFRDRSGRSYYQERVEVIRGKTLEVSPGYRG